MSRAHDRHGNRIAALLLALAMPCCGESGAPQGGTGAAPHHEPDAGSPFEISAEHAFDEKGKAALTVPLGSGYAALAVRTRLPGSASPAPCFQLDAVRDSNGLVWVPPADTSDDWGEYCATCAQRISLGYGYGFFVFPSDGSKLPEAGSVDLRVTLRNCETRLPFDPAFDGAAPASVIVETRRVPERDASARLRLDAVLAFAQGTQFQAATAAEDPMLKVAEGQVAAALSAAGIDLSVKGYVDVESSAEGVSYTPADRSQLDALHERARAAARDHGDPDRTLLLVFAPCITYEDAVQGTSAKVDGVAGHLPAGYSAGGYADAVFIQGAACGVGSAYWPSGDLLGKVLLHEIGHALGLYHSVEPDGRTDALADTDENNFMAYSPLEVTADGPSDSQARVMRAQPLLHE